MNYEMIATLGPASKHPPIWKAMLEAGATGFRLNTSHLSLPDLDAWLERLAPFLEQETPMPALVLDLQGSKWRLGDFESFELAPGMEVKFVHAPATGQRNSLPVPHADFFKAATVSDEEIVLNDARIRLQMTAFTTQMVTARVLQGGPIGPRKGITFTLSGYRQEALGSMDVAVIQRTQGLDFVRYAISYVKDAIEMAAYRKSLGSHQYLIAKIERRPAVDEAGAIAKNADEIWLCRGDLGAELGEKAMAQAVHRFSREIKSLPLPVLMAGQVLEHMTSHAAPTRSELCYLYDTLRRGYRGVVLSDETAIGRDPVASCRTAALFKDS